MRLLQLAAIVFDFDGVLVDSEPLHERAYQIVLGERGVSLTHERYYRDYLGFDDVGVFEAVSSDFDLRLGDADIEALIAEKSHVFESLLDDGLLFRGARECIERCAGAVPLAIASGARRQEIELILDRTALRPSFQHIVSAEDTARSKPAPDPYARAASLLGVDPARAVAIEDSRWGIASAAGAGLRVVAITTTYAASELSDADLIVSSLDDVDPSRLDAIIREHPGRP